jgi:hypothetical protein
MGIYQRSLRETKDWLTIGYVRKSTTNDSFASRKSNLQKMVNTLCLDGKCEQIYASPYSNADSSLKTRDDHMNETSQALIHTLRHVVGDWQSKYPKTVLSDAYNCFLDLAMLLKTTKLSVRLVVLDHRGLSTDPVDTRSFVK